MNAWDLLMTTVKNRLRTVVHAASAPHAPSTGSDAPHCIPTVVSECIQTLDQLHLSLAREWARREALLQQAALMRQAVAQLHAELAESRAVEQRALHLALHDALTGLPNRLQFQQRLDAALQQGEAQRQTLAVLVLDLDGLKPVNDGHGHDAGDAVLRIAAARLKAAVRADDVVARLGGDEFACLLRCNPAGRGTLAQRASALFDAIAAPMQVGDITLHMSVSIGVAQFPHDGDSLALLLKNADGAMYSAKRKHTGVAFFSPAPAPSQRVVVNGQGTDATGHLHPKQAAPLRPPARRVGASPSHSAFERPANSDARGAV
jgi:diguanylate cyclase